MNKKLTGILVIIMICIITTGGVVVFVNPHTDAKKIVTALDSKVDLEEFENCVKSNKRGINETYHGTWLGVALDERNYYPLHYAVKAGDYEKVKILLNYGADPNKKDPTVKETPLAFALKSGKANRFKIAKLLIKNGADPTIKSERSDIFSVAAIITVDDTKKTKNESTEFIKEMIIATDYINNKENYEPVITSAASNGNIELVKFIIENNIDSIDAVSQKTGATALINAVMGHKLNVCRYLINKGANKEIKDNEGKVAHDYAKEYGYTEISDLLLTSK